MLVGTLTVAMVAGLDFYVCTFYILCFVLFYFESGLLVMVMRDRYWAYEIMYYY